MRTQKNARCRNSTRAGEAGPLPAQACSDGRLESNEIENGGVSIGLDLLCRIADSLGVEVRALIEF